ncbi:hypothetical protein GCM10027275_42400 [Rhabdobacter roseus]|uniref:LiaI-LiaF-like transmembrane region domain-containing protein n=1 Tax=Rhabdobacter roseus TaxID=1655419 RepID=A0A840U2Z9_9BACT|nr:DUF5668 domain-containing protein [Rhabdobacter roseus]MBB5286219.1 hypothetical protein [Rhabdobacter roseus]
MKRSNGIFWGGLLVLFGVFWLLRNMGLLDIDWYEFFRFWPVLLILAGFSLLLSGSRRGGVGGGVAGILIALAVLGAITHRTDRAFDRHRNDWNFKWDGNDDDRYYHNDDDDDSRSSKRRSKRGGTLQNNHYEYEMEGELAEASLNFEGGAGSFKLKGTTDKLFEAKTRSSLGGFISNIRNNKLENSAAIDFKMEENKVEIKDGNLKNEVNMSLNEKPRWNVDLAIGAGKADFDFSKHQIKSLKVSTGVADVDLRFGGLADATDVKIESGVASVSIEVPTSVGCEVRVDGALNVTNLDDLKSMGDGRYQTPGFDQATKKITIRYEAGMSKLKIRRY